MALSYDTLSPEEKRSHELQTLHINHLIEHGDVRRFIEYLAGYTDTVVNGRKILDDLDDKERAELDRLRKEVEKNGVTFLRGSSDNIQDVLSDINLKLVKAMNKRK